MNEKTVWESYTEEDKKKVYDFCEEYRTFLSKCKTERECVKEILKEAEAKGYRSLKEVRRSGEKLHIPITIPDSNLIRLDKYIIIVERIDMGCIDYIRFIDP